MTKPEIREKMKILRNALPKKEQFRLSTQIQNRLLRMGFLKNRTRLFTYISVDSEVSTIGIIEAALSDNIEVYVPRTEGKELRFYRITDMKGLIKSSFGIPEPDPLRHVPYSYKEEENRSGLMLLPGLAFDGYGSRVGYGAGYYDRYLKEHEREGFIKAALAYEFQIMDHIDTDVHDIKADYIITPDRTINCMSYKEEDANGLS